MLNPLFLIALPFALPAAYIYLIFFVVLAFWIFRNTPYYPFVS